MEVRAIAKYVRMSSAKVGVVLDLIRGKSVNEAFAILKYIPRDTVEVINKTLKSVVASAENNHELGTNKLFVVEVHVGYGPTLKRLKPMDHGKVLRIDKRINNITFVVKERT